MGHPRTYADDDVLLARLRDLASRFPESSEVEAWGRPTFRAGRCARMSHRRCDAGRRPRGVRHRAAHRPWREKVTG